MYFAKGVEKVKTIEVSKNFGEHLKSKYKIEPLHYDEDKLIYSFADNDLLRKIIDDMGFFEKFFHS